MSTDIGNPSDETSDCHSLSGDTQEPEERCCLCKIQVTAKTVVWSYDEAEPYCDDCADSIPIEEDHTDE